MKIESGRYYKTRDGRKAFVVGAMSAMLGDCCAFAVQVGGDVHQYKSDGRWVYHNTSGHLNLVAEWTDPVSKTVWLHLVRRLDESIDSVVESEPCEPGGFIGTLLARKQITITEGEGMPLVQEFNPC